MVQVPGVIKVADVPRTVQTEGVSDENPTVSPELAVADKLSGVPTAWLGMAPKVMVCAMWWMKKVWSTCAASPLTLLPDWDVSIVQKP